MRYSTSAAEMLSTALNRAVNDVQESFDWAIGILKAGVALFPEPASIFACRAEAYMKAGSKVFAISNYEKALELDSTNAGAKKMPEQLRK